jgi:hypothetical protein
LSLELLEKERSMNENVSFMGVLKKIPGIVNSINVMLDQIYAIGTVRHFGYISETL